MRLCNKGLHDLDDPKIGRTWNDRTRLRIECRPCRNELRRLCASKKGTQYLPPDTEVVLQQYKEPLRPVENGFGYLGTLAYDKTSQYTQCHICGNLYQHLGKHIRLTHDMSTDEYKHEYGIEKSTSLYGIRARTTFTAQWENKTVDERAAILERLKLGRASEKLEGPREKRLEWYNKRGSCPDQIIDKILSLKEKIGQVPTAEKFSKEYGPSFVKVAAHHFGSWSEAVKQAGLVPHTGKTGPTPWYNEEFLIETLVNFRREWGREAMKSDIVARHIPSESAYRRVFGTWGKAKEAAYSLSNK